MALPDFNPTPTISRIILPATGSAGSVASTLAYGTYSTENTFLEGAADQVAYVYNRLGGSVLDIELTSGQVYNAYEEAAFKYSYLVNFHQARNVLSNALGSSTASFDELGEILSGSSYYGEIPISERYPQFDFGYSRRISDGLSEEAGVGGINTVYSASIDINDGQQDYDVQSILSHQSLAGGVDFAGLVGDEKVLVKKVFFKTPRATWRFYGYYGGVNVVGNMSTYGQFADDSSFEVIPAWQNKLQAMVYEDSIWTRLSHYSYELRNNRLRVYPIPYRAAIKKLWIRFTVAKSPFTEGADRRTGLYGVNNVSSLPFPNLSYDKINSMGKHWIRQYALAICKEMLAHTRGKFQTIPIPGNDITLNYSDLLTQAKDEQDKLIEELNGFLEETSYDKLIESDAETVENAKTILDKIPMPIFVR